MESIKELIGKPVIIRGYYCGCWAGILQDNQPENKTVVLSNAHRLWSWKAKTGICLSAIALNGVKGGNISAAVPIVQLGDCYEIIAATKKALQTIEDHVE